MILADVKPNFRYCYNNNLTTVNGNQPDPFKVTEKSVQVNYRRHSIIIWIQTCWDFMLYSMKKLIF